MEATAGTEAVEGTAGTAGTAGWRWKGNSGARGQENR